MDRAAAAQILRRLADGLDVETGEPLPGGSQYNRPEAIRALFAGAGALEAGAARAKGGPPNVGAAWTAEEEARLVGAFEAGAPLEEIAGAHGRTRGAVRSRLVRLGKIEAADSGAGPAAPARPAAKPDDAIPF